MLNEPLPGSPWPECRTELGCPDFDTLLSAFNTRVGEAIRKRDPDTLIVYDPHGSRQEPNLHEDRLNALARAYPRAIAGTPLQFSLDPVSRLFKLSYELKAVAAAPHAHRRCRDGDVPPRTLVSPRLQGDGT